MKRIIFLLILVMIGPLTLMVKADTEANIAFAASKALYGEKDLVPLGGLFDLFLKRNLDYFCIRANYGASSSEIKELGKEDFSVEVERVLWRNVVVGVKYNFLQETEDLFVYDIVNCKDKLLTKRWRSHELSTQAGLKYGNYKRSFVSVVGNLGISAVNKVNELKLLKTKIKTKTRNTILGLRVRARARLNTRIKLPLWFDFEGCHSYYLEDRSYRTIFVLGMGARLIKPFGLKFNIFNSCRKDKKGIEFFGYSAGLVIFLEEIIK